MIAGPAVASGPASAPSTAGEDLDRRSRIHDLVIAFYREVLFDDVLGPVFTEVAETDWSIHIPKLIDFWCRMLLNEPGYDGFVLGAHAHVHGIEAFRLEHFDRWYALWVATIDERWSGPNAEKAKERAARIGGTLARRLLDSPWEPAAAS